MAGRIKKMISNRQQAYLDAMGIETWTLRDGLTSTKVAEEALPTQDKPMPVVCDDEPAPETSDQVNTPGLRLGPGRGGVLLVCAEDTHSASRLSNDINRAMGGAPVWGWPDGGDKGVGLDIAIEENLFTAVGVFGEELGRQFFAGEIPQSLNSASLVILPSMADLETDGQARKVLWKALCRHGMISASDGQA